MKTKQTKQTNETNNANVDAQQTNVVDATRVMIAKNERKDDATYTPKMIAHMLGIDAKKLRKKLRASKIEGFEYNSHRWHFTRETITKLFPELKFE